MREGLIESDGRGPRIVTISFYFPPSFGGGGTQHLAVIHRMRTRGVHFDVMTAGAEASSTHPADGFFIRCFRPKIENGLGKLWFGLCAALWMLRHPRWDVLHLGDFSLDSVFPYAVARLLRRPVLVKTTLMEDGGNRSLSARVHDAVRIYGYRHSDMMVAISDALESVLSELGARGEILRIPNGVDMTRFRPPADGEARAERQAFGISESAFVPALCAARVSRKNAIDLIHAVARMAHRPVQLVLVGPPGEDEGYERELREAIAALPEGASAQVFDTLPIDDVARMLRAVDVNVLPSEREGMPNSVLEAMAAALPCVASDIPGSRDLLCDGGGSLVPLGDVTALAAALDAFASDPDLRARVGREGREIVRARYDLDRVADLYGAAYASLLSR